MSGIFQNIIAVPYAIGLLILFAYYHVFERLLEIVYFVLVVAVMMVWMLIKRIPRVLAFILWSVLLVLFFLATLPASMVGKSAAKSQSWLGNRSPSFNISNELHLLRGTFVDMLTNETDQDEYILDTEEEYREKIGDIPTLTKSRLETGEMIVSLVVAGGLLLVQFRGMSFIDLSLGGVSVVVLLQLYLLLLAVSIVYRVTLLDFVSYDGTEDLDGRDQWDAAYRFQAAMAFQSMASILLLLMAAGTVLVRTDYRVIDYSLRESIEEDRSGTELWNDVWEKMRSEQD